MLLTCPFVRPSVRRLLPYLWTQCFKNKWTDFWSAGQGHETINFRRSKVKVRLGQNRSQKSRD